MRDRTSLALLCAVVFAAVSARAADARPAVQRALVLEMRTTGIASEAGQALADDVALHLSRHPFLSVATVEDVRAMVRIAGDRQLLGCTIEADCLQGIAELLSADHVVHGTLIGASSGLTLNLVALDARAGTAIRRSNDEAADLATLRRRLPVVVEELAAAMRPTIDGQSPPPQSEVIKNRTDAIWAAVRHARQHHQPRSADGRRYTARFDSAHFTFDGYDSMRQALPVARRLLFPGEFPACLGRTHALQDSFVLDERRSLILALPRSTTNELESLRKDRKLELELVFEIVDTKLRPLPLSDTTVCGPADRPQHVPDLAPEVIIRVLGGRLVDVVGDRSFPLAERATDALMPQALPSPEEVRAR